MRSFAAFSSSILLPIAVAMPVVAEPAPTTAIACAWDKLPADEQTRMRDEFQVKLHEGSFTIYFGAPNVAGATQAARECQLNLPPQQLELLAVVLSRHAAVEKAKAGISARGDDPALIQGALAKMHEGKRQRIGDRLSCPGAHSMVKEWDESVGAAMRRARLRFNNSGTYAWISLGIYANMAQEGAIRRMNGQAEPCA